MYQIMSCALTSSLVLVFLVTNTSVSSATGLLDFMDPCKKAEAQYESTADAIRDRTSRGYGQLSAWSDDPTLIPADVLLFYRDAVKAYAFSTWKNSPDGKGTIASWGNPSDDVATEKFFEFIYPNKVDEATELKVARALYQKDYTERIMPELDKEIAEQNRIMDEKKAELDDACSSDVFSQVVRSTIGRVILIVDGNFEAAKDEKGEIAKLVRATSGISITDIAQYGLAGGENSELNKLRASFGDALTKAGIGENHEIRKFLRAIDVTNLGGGETPKEVQVNIDSGTAKNLCKNLTFGLGC